MMMKLRIQTLTSQSTEIKVDPQNTILDLKVSRRVQRRGGSGYQQDKVGSVRGGWSHTLNGIWRKSTVHRMLYWYLEVSSSVKKGLNPFIGEVEV